LSQSLRRDICEDPGKKGEKGKRAHPFLKKSQVSTSCLCRKQGKAWKGPLFVGQEIWLYTTEPEKRGRPGRLRKGGRRKDEKKGVRERKARPLC